MRLVLRWVAVVMLALVLAPAAPVRADPIGTATADFGDLRPGKGETAFGRLVADAVRFAGKSDIGFVNAGALRSGDLPAGPVDSDDLDALLTYGDDGVAVLTLSGAQIRAALERAAGVYPTSSPAFLDCSGLTATFAPAEVAGGRVGDIRIKGRVIGDQDTFSASMPVSLAEGAAGYFNIWSGTESKEPGVDLRDAVSAYFRAHDPVAPADDCRFGPG